MVQRDDTTLAAVLTRRYDEFKGSREPERRINQTQLAREVGISQPQISRLMSGDANFHRLSPTQLVTLLRGFHFTESEIEELAERYHFDDLSRWLSLERQAKQTHIRGVKRGQRVRNLGEINAGMSMGSIADERQEPVSVPDWIADRYDLGRVFAAVVTGDSMTCNEVKEAIPEGSMVYFLEGSDPEPGEVVCCYLLDEGINVVKVFRKYQGYVVLESYNKQHTPIPVSEDTPAELRGVYLTHLPRGPRLR